MTNKLVVIINILKVPKIKKILPNEMKLQLPPEPLTRGLPPPDPRYLCPQLNLLTPPPNKIPGYATAWVDFQKVMHIWRVLLALPTGLEKDS